MIINTNVPALNTHRQMGINQNAMQSSMEKLSSGLRINRAGDDAAGLAISEKMRAQINGLDQASRNAQDGISLIQTAEGALDETHSILQRMRELAVQAANDTNTASDRGEIQKEIDQLANEIDRIANTTEFNTQTLLDGSQKGLVEEKAGTASLQNNSNADIKLNATVAGQVSGAATGGTITITRVNETTGFDADDFSIGDPTSTGATVAGFNDVQFGGATISFATENLADLKSGESITITVNAKVEANKDVSDAIALQIGANTGQSINVGIQSMKANDLGVRSSTGEAINIESHEKATAAITTINDAIEKVSAQRSDLGAFQNRLEHTISNLDNSSENLSAAESRVRDVDMAAEMMEMMRANILSQASQSMLAQANQAPQSVLQLLG